MDPRKKYGWHSPSGGWVVTGLSPLGERERKLDRAVWAAFWQIWGDYPYKPINEMKETLALMERGAEMFSEERRAVMKAWREQHAR